MVINVYLFHNIYICSNEKPLDLKQFKLSKTAKYILKLKVYLTVQEDKYVLRDENVNYNRILAYLFIN